MREEAIKHFLEKKLKYNLAMDEHISRHVHEVPDQPLHYTLLKKKNAYIAEIKTFGIPRHPVQLYESIAYIITLLLHFYWWQRKNKVLRHGIIAASATITSYGLRFICEFFKEPFNTILEGPMIFTTGHLLSFLTVLGGIVMLIYSYKVPKDLNSG